MIEEPALVIALEQGEVVVQTQRASSCGSCASKQGCGPSTLSEGMGRGYTELRVATDLDVRVGDRVMLAIDESALLKGAVFIYLLPLAAMIIGGLLGDYCSSFFAINNELLTICFGVLGVIGSLLLARFNSHAQRFQRRITPKVLEILQ